MKRSNSIYRRCNSATKLLIILLCITLTLTSGEVLISYTPASSPTPPLLEQVSYSPTTVAHAKNLAAHTHRYYHRKLEDAADEEEDADDAADNVDAYYEYYQEEEEGYTYYNEYDDYSQYEDDDDDDDESQDSDSQSQDGDDDDDDGNNNNNMEQRDQEQWYADDPYFPYYDDQISKELLAEYEAEQIEAMNEEEMRQAALKIRMHKTFTTVVYAFMSIVGFLATIFCTSIFTYFLRVQTLMRRYKRNGVKVISRIVLSEADIEQAMREANDELASTEDKSDNRLHHERNNSHTLNIPPDSYSMMTDDDSYIQTRMSTESKSSDESVAAAARVAETSRFKDIEEAAHVDTGEVNVKEQPKQDHQQQQQQQQQQEQRHHQHQLINTAVSFAAGSAHTKSTTKSNDTIISQRKRRFYRNKFRVIVEYDDITYHDEINQDSSDIIRKCLLVRGEDILQPQESSSKTVSNKYNNSNTNNKQLQVKLHVLQDEPTSGYPSGEIKRSLRWQKWLTFFVYHVIGCALILSSVVMTKLILPVSIFYGYIGLLLLQIPFVQCFLQPSFNEIISKEYLEDGLSLQQKKDLDDGGKRAL